MNQVDVQMATTNEESSGLLNGRVKVSVLDAQSASGAPEIFHLLNINWLFPDSFVLPNHNFKTIANSTTSSQAIQVHLYSKSHQINL